MTAVVLCLLSCPMHHSVMDVHHEVVLILPVWGQLL